jgi:hypothetical protein
MPDGGRAAGWLVERVFVVGGLFFLGYIRWGLGNLALAWLAGWRGSWGDNLGFSVLVLFFFLPWPLAGDAIKSIGCTALPWL